MVMASAAVLGDAGMLAVPALHGSSPGTLAAPMAINFAFGACGLLVSAAAMALSPLVNAYVPARPPRARTSHANGSRLTPPERDHDPDFNAVA
ncbi:hypothetical protein E1267_12555 [Nonomuraea longispora]|uniref:Uncharacterized protein n=1 Tax=Nonomuraea longispora TaxID=1848320 RepID=A0A4R4NEZ4_9ACTN|nr:hypothetical protein [Nonomuraea longispora]TDC07768.1 hypothetical protein E1267_12555 [Nonomuraea longispora]